MLALIAAVALTGCGSGSSEAGTQTQGSSDEKIVIQLNSSQSRGTLAWIGAHRMQEIIDEELGPDRVEIQFFSDGQLGTDSAILEGMLLGTHDALIVGTPITAVDSKFSLFDLPFLFTSREEVEAVTKGEIGQRLNASLEEKGYVNLAYWFVGWRQISNNIRPIYTPEDLKGIKLRVPASPAREALFKNLGANPTPLSFGELFSALQQGVVDGQENPVYVLEQNSFKDVQKYLSKTNHVVSLYQIVFSKSKWDSYPQDVQDALRKAALQVADESWQITEDLEAEVYEKIKGSVEINEADLDSFKDAAMPIYELPDFVDSIGEDLINDVLVTLGRK